MMKNMSSSFVPMVYDRTFEEWPSRAQPFELYLTFLAELSSTKGQIISKGLFGVLKFSQKRNEGIRLSSKKEFEDTKSSFQIIWPLIYHWIKQGIPWTASGE